jgi:aryl-alcohol dehydrogenase-like predicted oxidoreductase
LRNSVDNANKILGGENCVDVFGPAEADPKVPIEATSEVLAQLLKGGKIGSTQFPEVRADTFRRASEVRNVDMVVAEVSLPATDFFSNTPAL